MDRNELRAHDLELADIGPRLTHHLRTPLATARSATQLLMRMVGDPETVESMADTTLRSLDRIGQALTAFEALLETHAEHESSMDLGGVFAASRAIVAARWDEHDRLQIIAPEPVPNQNLPGGLSAALAEIIDNAIRFDRSGGPIEVRTSVVDSRIDAIEVMDRGCGIPDDHSRRVFQPFFSTTEDRPGVGLSLAALACGRHGARLTWQNRDGGGCRFSLNLEGVIHGPVHDHRG
jgi:signal transduction histidine kinase